MTLMDILSHRSADQLKQQRENFALQQEAAGREDFLLGREKAGLEKQKFDIEKSMFNKDEYAQQLRDENAFQKKKRDWELKRMDDLNTFRNRMGLGGGGSQQTSPSRLSIARGNMGLGYGGKIGLGYGGKIGLGYGGKIGLGYGQ